MKLLFAPFLTLLKVLQGSWRNYFRVKAKYALDFSCLRLKSLISIVQEICPRFLEDFYYYILLCFISYDLKLDKIQTHNT